MNWKDIGKALISQGAPLVGGLLGGPAGASAGKLVAGLFDADPDNPEEVMNAIQADPESMIKIREFEMKHKEKLQELQLDETKAFLSDVDSARRREAAITEATGGRDIHIYILAYIVIVSFFMLALFLMWGLVSGTQPATDSLKDSPLAMLLIGALISGFTQVLSYFFGSSKGSSDKNKVLSAKG